MNSNDIDVSAIQMSEEDITRIVSEIDRRGYACLPNFVSGQELQQARDFVACAVKQAGHDYVFMKGAESTRGTVLGQLGISHGFQTLFQRLYGASSGRSLSGEPLQSSLRCLAGSGMSKHSLHFHYDTYAVTGIIPIEIPSEGRRGDLIVLPGTRGIRRFYLVNLLEKAILESRLVQSLLHWASANGKLRQARIEMVPGNLYLFWGYRSIHTNEPCESSRIRATAVFHYADPHAGSSLKAMLRRGRADHAADIQNATQQQGETGQMAM